MALYVPPECIAQACYQVSSESWVATGEMAALPAFNNALVNLTSGRLPVTSETLQVAAQFVAVERARCMGGHEHDWTAWDQ